MIHKVTIAVWAICFPVLGLANTNTAACFAGEDSALKTVQINRYYASDRELVTQSRFTYPSAFDFSRIFTAHMADGEGGTRDTLLSNWQQHETFVKQFILCAMDLGEDH